MTFCRYLLLGQERRSCRLSLLVYNKVLEASLRNCRDKR
uniref:Uncharacterized protein n=1 Tax=Populus trichocarpa TaxID=3694 RepID=A9PG18_POPTR|nr:unknown [Populus trichocarpa]